MWDDFGAAQVHCDQTLAYMRYSLGLQDDCPSIHDRIILNFGPIGKTFKAAYGFDQRRIIYDKF